MIAIDLSKQEELGGDPKPKQQINFTVDQVGKQQCFHYCRRKINYCRIFTRNFESVVNLFWFNIILI